MNPPSSGPTAAAMAAAAPTSAYRPAVAPRPSKCAVDELTANRRQQQRCAEPAHDRPEDDDRGQALRQSHGKGADRVVRAGPAHTRALRPIRSPTLLPIRMNAADTSASSAIADLNPADGRMQIVDDRCDGDVHHRRVDDQGRTSPSPSRMASLRSPLARAGALVPDSPVIAGSPSRQSLTGCNTPHRRFFAGDFSDCRDRRRRPDRPFARALETGGYETIR